MIAVHLRDWIFVYSLAAMWCALEWVRRSPPLAHVARVLKAVALAAPLLVARLYLARAPAILAGCTVLAVVCAGTLLVLRLRGGAGCPRR